MRLSKIPDFGEPERQITRSPAGSVNGAVRLRFLELAEKAKPFAGGTDKKA